MKWKHLLLTFLLIGTISACTFLQNAPEDTNPPTETNTLAPTDTPGPTPTPTELPTETPTPFVFLTPEGENFSLTTMVRLAVFIPPGYESITGIYRYDYAYTAVYQGEEYWEKAFAFLDLDISDQLDLPLELFLVAALENLDYFNVTVDDTGAVVNIETNFPGSKAIDFTGTTQDVPIQGQMIGFKPDDDHVVIGLAWFDISIDPAAWNNEGVNLFHFIMGKLVIEE